MNKNNVCQNCLISNQKNIFISIHDIIQKYIRNNLSNAIIFGGFENFDEFEQMYWFINIFRNIYNINDDIIIYTGYYPNEIEEQINKLKQFENIFIKFGRYIQNSNQKYDEILGIYLASDNQYTIKIS